MSTEQSAPPVATLAKSLAPEEVRPGEYIGLLDEIYEYPSWLRCCDSSLTGDDRVVRLKFTARDSGVPLLVWQVCVPFVFVRTPGGKPRTLDLRKCRVALLDKRYARFVVQQLKPKRGGKSGKKKRLK